MTAYELRKHLAADHGVHLTGADFALLLTIHDDEHRNPVGHVHDDGTTFR